MERGTARSSRGSSRWPRSNTQVQLKEDRMRKVLMSVSVLAVMAVALSVAMADHHEKGEGVQIGATAPSFALQDQDGKTVNLADAKGKIVVLEWFNNECPFVQRHYKAKTMTNLADKYK